MKHPGTLTENWIKERLGIPCETDYESDSRYASFFFEPHRPAAVLVPLIKNQKDEWQILFTRRTEQVADHKGQVAFPGGRSEDVDQSVIDTALREAHEEIGLLSQDVQILGTLEGMYTVTNYLVTPVIGLIKWPFNVILESKEVERVFTIPVRWLVHEENFQIRTRVVTFPNQTTPQNLQIIYYEPYDGEVLWGFSAEITIRLLKRLLLM